jgi:hypothetical protein
MAILLRCSFQCERIYSSLFPSYSLNVGLNQEKLLGALEVCISIEISPVENFREIQK